MKRAAIILLALIMILILPFSYTYWGGFSGAENNYNTIIHVGDYADEPALGRLPPGTPDYIVDQLKAIKNSDPAPSQIVLDMLVDGVISIIESLPAYDHALDKVIIGSTADNLFEDSPNVGRDSLLIYVATDEDSNPEVVVIHINPDSNFNINNAQDLQYALDRPWTGVNQVSNMWLSGNLYTTYNTPVEYQGSYYLMYHNGPSGTPPSQDRNTWFILPNPDYGYTNDNILINRAYWQNYIIKFQSQYYIASTDIWGQTPLNDGRWHNVTLWQSASYNAGTVVYTLSDDGTPRFWRCLSQNTQEPGETSAQAGLWREINNGWIGNGNDRDVKSYYYAHNTYSSGSVVIYGVSAKLKYRYYRAKKSVPAGELPLTATDGLAELNSEYWESY